MRKHFHILLSTVKFQNSSFSQRVFPLLGLMFLLFYSHSVSAQSTNIRDSNLTWTLSQGAMVSVGETLTIEQGTMTRDVIIEARAVSSDPSLMREGVFRATLSAFSPGKDSARQLAGVWYVRGQWSLRDLKAPNGNNYKKHLPGVIVGQLQMVLPENPVLYSGDWSANLRIPQTVFAPVGPVKTRQPLRGEGLLILDGKLNGELTLDLKLWPKI